MSATASYPTTGGARVEVVGPNPWGEYEMPCTGCDTSADTGDVPADQAQATARALAQYHAKHCTATATTAFQQVSGFPGWGPWNLAREAHHLRSLARYSDDPKADTDRRISAAFTADEVRRIDAYLAAGISDTARLAAIEARLDTATDDTRWLAWQLKQAWADLDKLRDRIDDAGSSIDTSYVASAIRYVRWSRKTD